MEIGSEFTIEKIETVSNSVKEKIEDLDNVCFTSSGRGAISLILSNIQPVLKTVLLPIYICESVISVFESFKYKIYFYDLNTDFSPICGNYEEIGVFFHMGYFGFDTNKNIVSEIELMKQLNIIVIEDLTHNLFSNFKTDSFSDYYCGSIRKWLGIPSGGFVSGKKKLELIDKYQTDFVNTRIENFLLKREFLETTQQDLKGKFLLGFSKAEEILNEDNSSYSIDELSLQIINGTSVNNLIKKRRDNYQYLLDNLSDNMKIKILFNELPKNVTPLFFLIDVGDERDVLRKYLAENAIYCPIHWPMAKLVENQITNFGFGNTYSQVISIPCDQRYDEKDMRRIVEILSLFGG